VKLNNVDTTFSKELATDAAGRFAAPDIPIGKYDITASATGFQTQMISRSLSASENIDITITLEKVPSTGTIQGTLRDVVNAFIPGGDVELNNGDTGFNRHVTSNAAGRFVAPNIPIGNYDITASAAGFQPTVLQRSLAGGETIDLTITLQTPPTARIEGSVVDAAGAIVSNVQVVITNTGTNTTTTVLTDAAGQFVVPNMTPGNYSIKVNVPTSLAEQHTLVAGQTLNLQLKTSP